MEVKLISISKSLIEVNGKELTPEELIVYTARVSSPQNQENLETSAKLLKYLITHKHWSPLEMVTMTVEIKTSRAIAQQILRHRSFSFQEFSQRYAQVKYDDFYMYQARSQDLKNRQNSVDDLSHDVKEWFYNKQEEIFDIAQDAYKEAIDKGIAKECARFLLPLNTKTTLFMTGSIRSWVHYLELRSSHGTQKEHAEIANTIKDAILKKNFPSIAEAMGW
jgi:thymidylate synthase (FAD)